MPIARFTVDVKSSTQGGSYRLLVDGDLLTERTFIWPSDHWVNESIIVNVPPGEHTVAIHRLDGSDAYLSNLSIQEAELGTTFVIV